MQAADRAELEKQHVAKAKRVEMERAYRLELARQTQLEEERGLADRLSAELEAPENSKRWRKLEGKDPEPEDLAAKLQVLEERVNDKKEQLLEKDLVLEEVSNLANRLRTQALEGREDTLELAKRVNLAPEPVEARDGRTWHAGSVAKWERDGVPTDALDDECIEGAASGSRRICVLILGRRVPRPAGEPWCERYGLSVPCGGRRTQQKLQRFARASILRPAVEASLR